MPDRCPQRGGSSDLLQRQARSGRRSGNSPRHPRRSGRPPPSSIRNSAWTGALGIDSSDLKHLPEWGSRYYSIAPGISWPILDWTKLHAAIRVANEQQAQALLGYQTAVSQALKDVEDALVQYEQEHRRHAALLEAVAQARQARKVTAQIYSQGLADETADTPGRKGRLPGGGQPGAERGQPAGRAGRPLQGAWRRLGCQRVIRGAAGGLLGACDGKLDSPFQRVATPGAELGSRLAMIR